MLFLKIREISKNDFVISKKNIELHIYARIYGSSNIFYYTYEYSHGQKFE
jgi:hypothetical protein